MRIRPRTVVFIVVFVIIAALAWAVLSAANAKPDPSIDFAAQLEAVSSDAQPAGENGWPHLAAAITAWEQFHAGYPQEGLPDAHARGVNYQVAYQVEPPPTAEDVAWVNDILAALDEAGVLAGVDLSSACPNIVRPLVAQVNGGPLITVFLPELAVFRNMAKASAADLDRAIATDDAERAARSLRRMLTLARACAYQTTLIDHLVSWAIISLASSELRASILAHDPDAATLDALRAVYDEVDPGSMTLALAGERAMFLDVVQRLFSGDADGNGIFLPSAQHGDLDFDGSGGTGSVPAPGIANVIGYFLPRRKAIETAANDYYDLAEDEAARTRAERAAEPGRLGKPSADGNFLLRTLVPAMDRAIEQRDRVDMEIAATRVFLAIEAHRRTQGAAPTTLDALVPGLLAAIPTDPFAQDGRFRYVVNDDGTYVLYAVGLDETDDGGRGHGREAMRGFTEPGLDYVINAPRARE